MYKELIKEKKAVFFDMDGTMIDSEPLWDAAFAKVGASIGFNWYVGEPVLRGVPAAEKWHYYLDHTEFEPKLTANELTKHTYTEFIKQVEETKLETRDGFISLVAELRLEKGFKIALVTNTPKEVTDQVISYLDIAPAFDMVICGDEVKKPKPDPEIYLTAARVLKLKPKEVLVFEDSLAGVRAAHKAKMDIVVIWNGEIEQEDYPKGLRGFIPDFTALPGNLDTDLGDELKKYAEYRQAKQAKKSS